MKTYKIIVLILFHSLLSRTEAQYKLIDERINGKTYNLTIELEPIDKRITNEGGINRISFKDYIDESLPGGIQLPKRELFIAIPANSIPIVNYKIVEEEVINAIPKLNPSISLTKENQIINREMKEWNYKTIPVIKNDGIVQIENNRCIHLTVSQFIHNSNSKSISQIKKLAIELSFKTDLVNNSIKKNINRIVSDIILNKDFAVNNNSSFSIKENNTTDEWIDYQREYIKLGVGKDGIYRINYNDLNKLLDIASIDPVSFKMYWKGKEIPIYVKGEDDHHFDLTDFIEFVGLRNYGGHPREINAYNSPYNEYLDRYSDTTIVWLTWGKNNGLRVTNNQYIPGSSNKTINYYNCLTHYEQNIWFDFSTDQLTRRQFPEWTENETWGWRNQDVGSIDLEFAVSNLVLNKTCKAYVKLQSYASDITRNAHKVGLKINNDSFVYDSLYFDLYNQRLLTANFNSNLLTNGTNRIRSVLFSTQASLNSVYHDWYEVEYPRNLILTNDSISFRFNDYKTKDLINYELTEYKGSEISLYRFSNMLNVIKIGNYLSQQSKITFTDMLDSTQSYICVPVNKLLQPKIYFKKKFVNLRSNLNTAEYVLITHPKLENVAKDYLKLISDSYHKKSKLINIIDIYDEFNYGYFSPEPIKDFLINAYSNWSGQKLDYVLLLGSANYDYYENRQKQLPAPSHSNLVPSFGVPASDNWFINWEKEGVFSPQLKIGRIPARTSDDVTNYLTKHKTYLEQSYSEANKRYLFFSGGFGTNQGELDLLKNGNQIVIDNYVKPAPIGGIVSHFYKTVVPNTNFGPYSITKVQNSIDSSGVIISYLGHSGTQTWDNSITDVKQLKNKVNSFPLMTDFGCSTAKFAEPDVTSFSELFTVSSEGQAIAYIGNSSLGFTSSSTIAPSLFYETILKDSVLNISDALNKAKQKLLTKYGASDVNKIFCLTNTLIGDPIVSLKIPPKPNLTLNSNSFRVISNNISSVYDSAQCRVRFNNTGRVLNKKFKIGINDKNNGAVSYAKEFTCSIPLISDSLIFNIPIKGKAGEHLISINLDSNNVLDEINKDDNRIEVSINVPNSTTRDLLLTKNTNSLFSINLLNPISINQSSFLDLKISDTPDFQKQINSKIQIGELYTKYSFETLQKGKRYWYQVKLSGDQNYELTKSFYNSSKPGIIFNDSTSFQEGVLSNAVFVNSLKLGRENVSIESISAGFNDGNTSVITLNNQNIIPWPITGHNVGVVDGNTFTLKSLGQFNLLFGGTVAQEGYQKMIDTLKTNDIIAISIADEGGINLSASIKKSLKDLGSKYVDSVGFRDSWAFICRKGDINSVSESYAKIFKGRAIAKAYFKKNAQSGQFETEFIGPVKKWNELSFDFTKPTSTKIYYVVLGQNIDGKIDTLKAAELSDNKNILLSAIQKYPSLKVITKLTASSSGESPEIKSLFMGYTALPELGINYQTVSLEKDTLEQGEDCKLKFSVYNVGESTASNFKVTVDLVKKDNSKEKIFEQVIDSIRSENKKQFELACNTSQFYGNAQFQINIDPENKITELYKDNNFYSTPFYVKPNSKPASLKLTIDGNDILNGDFISPKPIIKIELNDESLISINDTNKVLVYLNNKRVYFSNSSKNISYSFSSSNPKMVVSYTPELENGDYTLKVIGKNATDQVIDSAGVVRKFSVKNELQLLDAFNYPNPFKDDTYFTFKLTQIPDEIKILIYTIAGRKIKEMKINGSELHYDFNRIYWDGRDADGDLAANGTYIYKIISAKGGEKTEVIQKLSIIR